MSPETENSRKNTLRDVYNEGYRRVCIGCNTVFKPDCVRREMYEDGHGGRLIEMCRCGCDLIGHIVEADSKLYISPEPKLTEKSILFNE